MLEKLFTEVKLLSLLIIWEQPKIILIFMWVNGINNLFNLKTRTIILGQDKI